MQIYVSTSEEVFFPTSKGLFFFIFFSRCETTADGSRQQQHKIGKMRAAELMATAAGGGAVEAQVVQQQQPKSGENVRS